MKRTIIIISMAVMLLSSCNHHRKAESSAKVTDKRQAILSESILPMEGAYNFRDLGGIKTKDEKHTKWGKIFRAGDLGHLTDSDISYLNNLPLTSVVDFRTSEEISALPDKLPSFTQSYELSISPGNLSASSIEDLIDLPTSQLDSIMMEMNRLLISEESSIKQYKTFFALLQDEKQLPLTFHCSAGKDRTGMAAALLLYSLGVDEELILENYLLSNIHLKDKYAEHINAYPNLKPLLSVKAEFIQAGFDEINTKYGSIEEYLENVLEVDIAKMRELYLY